MRKLLSTRTSDARFVRWARTVALTFVLGWVRNLAFALALGGLLGGCALLEASDDKNYVKPIGGALVTDNDTPYSQSLRCVRQKAALTGKPSPRIAIGQVNDLTGKNDYYTGRQITQGAALMVISAFSKGGVPMVERFDTSVTELELKYANNKLIGDQQSSDYRKIAAGSIVGSDYYVIGGVTELNFNIRSEAIEALVGPASFSGRYYVLNIGFDLRLVNTRTLVVEDVVSYQKQIIGREIRAGVFQFIGTQVLDVSAGDRSQEPVQMAVRAVSERAALELIGRMYGIPTDTCQPDANEAKNGMLAGLNGKQTSPSIKTKE